MAQEPTCSCSTTTGPAGPSRIIFPCAGQANTGQLTNLAAIQLTEEGYGNIACQRIPLREPQCLWGTTSGCETGMQRGF